MRKRRGRASRGPARHGTQPPALAPVAQPTALAHGWGPGALLRPDREVVPFTGREAELGVLRAWCDSRAARSVRIIIGPGGSGKTRLARQLGAEWAAAGGPWRLVAPGDEAHAAAAARSAGPDRRLLVVDDAETRTGLAALLDAALGAGRQSRVLLIARSLGEWWDVLAAECSAGAAQLLRKAPPVRTEAPLSPGRSDADVAAAAVPPLARALSLEVRGDVQVDRAAVRLPVLLLHAAALVGVLRAAAGGQHPVRVVISPRVLDELIEYELGYWRATAGAARLPCEAALVTQAVTVATLTAPRSVADAAALLARVPALSGDPQARLEWGRWIAGLYPAGPNGRIGGLQPDLLAERLAVRELAADPVLARAFLRALPPQQADHAMTLLAHAFDHAGQAAELVRAALHYDLAHLAGPAARVAQQVPGPLPDLLAEALCQGPAAPESLADIARELPQPSVVLAHAHLITLLRLRGSLAGLAGRAALDECDDLAAGLLRRLDEWARTAGSGRERGAGGPRHETAGLQGRGAGGGEAVGRGEPGGWQAVLAPALSGLAERLSERGLPQDAARAERAAVRMYRDLASLSPRRHRADLASSLANLGVWLAASGLAGDAVRPAREAAVLLRELAAADPARYRPLLATSLTNLAIWYTRAGRDADAVPAAREAVAVRRALLAADPARHRPELASSLSSLATMLSALGLAGEAAAARAEAAALSGQPDQQPAPNG